MRTAPGRTVVARLLMAPTAESVARRGDVLVAGAGALDARLRRWLSSDRFVLRGDVVVDRVALEVEGADRGRGREVVAGLPKRGLVALEAGDFNGRYERGADGRLD